MVLLIERVIALLEESIMCPDVRFLGMDLYWWFIIIGVIAAMAVARLLHKRAGISFKIFRFAILVLVGSVIIGYLFAMLFQSWYSYLETGVFRWGVGATFYGGLIGGVAVFLAAYFGIGHFMFKDKKHIREFHNVVSLFVPCVALAHGFGRIGCLCAGCCYGALTDSWVGLEMLVRGKWQKRVPIQLFETFFLFALFAVLATLIYKKKLFDYMTSMYMIAYGVWRFCIEFARDDVRGASGIPGLTPSQLTAIIMVIAGVGLIFLYKYLLKNFYARMGGVTESDLVAQNATADEVAEQNKDQDLAPATDDKERVDEKAEEV